MQQVVPDSAPFFISLKRALWNSLLPALLGVKRGNVGAKIRELLDHGVKGDGIGIRNPVATAPSVFTALNEVTNHLIDSLLNKDVGFKLCLHHSLVNRARAGAKAT